MNQDDPEERIRELERLAEAKAAAGDHHAVEQRPQIVDRQVGAGQGAVDEDARRHAEALMEGLRTGGPSAPEVADLRAAIMRAAADAGMSEAQINDALQHAHVTIQTGHSVVYPAQGDPPTALGLGDEADRARARQQAEVAAAAQRPHEVWSAIDSLVREFIPEAVRRGIRPKGFLIKSWRVVDPAWEWHLLQIYQNGKWVFRVLGGGSGGGYTAASSRRPDKGCENDPTAGLREGALRLLNS